MPAFADLPDFRFCFPLLLTILEGEVDMQGLRVLHVREIMKCKEKMDTLLS